MLERGYIQLYTGHGKGKTTAALGLALRAAGAGLKTIVIQFMKGQSYSELEAVKALGGAIVIEQYGSPLFCRPDDVNIDEHVALANQALTRSGEVLTGGDYDIVILDEICTANLFKLVKFDDIVGLITSKAANTELVLTGRGAPGELYQYCDLITEMKEIKHYYQQGVQAREGIEN
ncbi:MAG TPA: cob(I)yrinic acid a,c-diamide adenosyltransferase [Spirochaetota bacterium]|nr:cob(I)yrinic acid a,c-diamide adenosyltransferase [Spirochaetota bacterium]